MPEWDKLGEEAVKATYAELHKQYPPPKKPKQSARAPASAADDGDNGDDDGTPKYEETLIPEKWWAKLANDHTKIVAKDDLVVLFGSRYVTMK
jgi:hypothetical protein